MIPRRLHKYVAVIAGALVAGLPVVMIHRGLDAYVERQASEEVRLAAQRAIARAEWRIGQVIAALSAVGMIGLRTCANIDPGAVRHAVMATAPLKEISVTDEAGTPRCLSQGTTRAAVLSRELRTADDRVFLAVMRAPELDERALRVIWRRADDPLQLAAQIPADVFLSDGSSSTASSDPAVRVMLSEGTVIAAPAAGRDDATEDGDTIRAHNQSSRYPLLATATVSRTAVFAEHADLRSIGLLVGAVLALLTIALALLIPLRGRSNPIAEMERALENNEFIPYYQPVVDLRTGAIVGAEVLMRWRKADGSVIPPAAFIPLAESSGLIMEMTRALMRSARDEFAQVLGLRPRVRIGFNLTARHFASEAIVGEIREIFAGSPIRMSQIVLEVTERDPLGDLDTARRVIASLQEFGCKVAIDDVGTGHGGLSYMLKLGANYIKIDKLFIDAIGTERYSTAIIETLIELARRMRMEIFAAGVENFDQVKYLRERGIFLAQGYTFAPPLPGALFRQLLEAAHPLGVGAVEDDTPAAIDQFMEARERVAAA